MKEAQLYVNQHTHNIITLTVVKDGCQEVNRWFRQLLSRLQNEQLLFQDVTKYLNCFLKGNFSPCVALFWNLYYMYKKMMYMHNKLT